MNCIVLGATGDIGACMAEEFAVASYQTHLVAQNEGRLKYLHAYLTRKNLISNTYVCDISQYENVCDVISAICHKANSIDIAINCSGLLGEQTEIYNSDVNVWQQVLATNLTGAYFAMRAVLPHMIRQKWGILINLTSNRAKYYRKQSADYSVSKFGIRALTNISDLECKPFGVRCFAINPGRVASKMRQMVAPEEDQSILNTPTEVASFCVKICDRSLYMALPCSMDYDKWKNKI